MRVQEDRRCCSSIRSSNTNKNKIKSIPLNSEASRRARAGLLQPPARALDALLGTRARGRLAEGGAVILHCRLLPLAVTS